MALPSHLRALAHIDSAEVSVEVDGDVSIASVLDAVEAQYPVLRGTIRDHGTHRRRDFMRYFACEKDYSHEPADTPLPERVVTGDEAFRVVGAIAGG